MLICAIEILNIKHFIKVNFISHLDKLFLALLSSHAHLKNTYCTAIFTPPPKSEYQEKNLMSQVEINWTQPQ